MGKGKTQSKSLKSSQPVAFPHDGPIHHCFRRQLDGSSRIDDAQGGERHQQDQRHGSAEVSDDWMHEESLTAALRILSAIEGLSDPSQIPATSACTTLCWNLRHSAAIKEQLKHLQQFKNQLLLHQKRGTLSHFATHQDLCAIYRLQLEWSFSHQTPLPLRRAIQTNLSTLADFIAGGGTGMTDLNIRNDVLRSLWNSAETGPCWDSPMDALEIIVTYEPMAKMLQKPQGQQDLFQYLHAAKLRRYLGEFDQAQLDGDQTFMKDGLKIAEMIKISLSGSSSSSSSGGSKEGKMGQQDRSSLPQPSLLGQIKRFLLSLMSCPMIQFEHKIVGIAYAKLILKSSADPCSTATDLLDQLDRSSGDSTIESDFNHLPLQAHLSLIQGLVGSLTSQVLCTQITVHHGEQDVRTTLLEKVWRHIITTKHSASDPAVRFGALSALSGVLNRYKSITKTPADPQSVAFSAAPVLIDETLDIVMHEWENPPMRKIGTMLPGLFAALISYLDDAALKSLTLRVVEQPAHRKGRYLALEALLPKVNVVEPSQSHDLTIHPETLLDGIGDRGGNTGAIADLWISILNHLWTQLHQGIKNATTQAATKSDKSNDNDDHAFHRWTGFWIESLVRALLDPILSRRKQVSSFCIPRLADYMKRSKVLRPRTSAAFASMLSAIEANDHHVQRTSHDELRHRLLWAKLETIRQVHAQKAADEVFAQSIAANLSHNQVEMAMVHCNEAVRIAACQALPALRLSIADEARLWKVALPSSLRSTESKDYINNILQCLCGFLERYMQDEGRCISAGARSATTAANPSPPAPTPNTDQDETSILEGLYGFVTNDLIHDFLIRQHAYPGTIMEKESSCLSFLACILGFATQDQSLSNEKSAAKNSSIFKRRRSAIETRTAHRILQVVVGDASTIAVAFGLLQSDWDAIRSLAFRTLSRLVHAANEHGIEFPAEYASAASRQIIAKRAIYLASSPRQREADTGARMLVFLFLLRPAGIERTSFFDMLLGLLTQRLAETKTHLHALFSGSADRDGRDLPLAHGVIHGIRLCIEQIPSLKSRRGAADLQVISDDTYSRLLTELGKALKMSLSIVADIHAGASLEGLDDDDDLAFDGMPPPGSGATAGTPLNVNTGAIGANGTFTSVQISDDAELIRRLAFQRVVVGSWLLTKEACAAVAATISVEEYVASTKVINDVGILLINTLASLKHAGAAFAAHDALQQIATACISGRLGDDAKDLLRQWIDRLFDEISESDKVRDSTLRRSTGYGLGFLAIMRASVSLSAPASSAGLCQTSLKQLLKFTLPSPDSVKLSLSRLDIDVGQLDGAFSFLKHDDVFHEGRSEETSSAQTRVHAMNVLRLILLDAPLANEVRLMIGDAVVASLLGYNDLAWAVRNSSTMVFAAAMLRSIDPDKNASNKDTTSSNAITVSELARRYPALLPFLKSMLRSGVASSSQATVDLFDSVEKQIHPILLLLSRVQSVAASGTLASGHISSFIPLVQRCLQNRDFSVRAAAARALANICSGNHATIFNECLDHVIGTAACSPKQVDFNHIHGSLLGIRGLLSSDFLDGESCRQRLLHSDIFEEREVPPPCLETYVACLDDMVERVAAEHHPVILQAAKKWLARDCGNSVGFSKLRITVGTLNARVLSRVLWSTDAIVEEAAFDAHLAHMRSLFEHDDLDVRFSAVKTFKKSMDQRIADAQSLFSASETRVAALSRIAGTLLTCLHNESKRGAGNSSSNIDVTGTGIGAGTDVTNEASTQPHPPTVRRLSRCYLECIYAIMDASGAEKPRPQDAMAKPRRVESKDLIWNVARSMEHVENSVSVPSRRKSASDAFSSTDGYRLLANTVEMMAIALSAAEHDLPPAHETISTAADSETTRLSTFVDRCAELVNGDSYWRCRHSVVIAIQMSGLLATIGDLNGASSTGAEGRAATPTDDAMSKTRQRLFALLTMMLQDNDQDVREAAARAVSQTVFVRAHAKPDDLHEVEKIDAMDDVTPSMLLQHVFTRGQRDGSVATERRGVSTSIAIALATAMKTSDGIVAKLKAYMLESSYLQEVETLEHIYNSTTTRKIFEKEEPNQSYDKCLAIQLEVLSWWNNHTGEDHAGDRADCARNSDDADIDSGKRGSSVVGNLEALRADVLTTVQQCLECMDQMEQGDQQLQQSHTEGTSGSSPIAGSFPFHVTRSPLIFASLHSILLAAAVVLHGSGANRNKKEARRLADISTKLLLKYGSTKPGASPESSRCHPEVVKAIRCVVDQAGGESDTQDRRPNPAIKLEDCLFLLH